MATGNQSPLLLDDNASMRSNENGQSQADESLQAAADAQIRLLRLLARIVAERLRQPADG